MHVYRGKGGKGPRETTGRQASPKGPTHHLPTCWTPGETPWARADGLTLLPASLESHASPAHVKPVTCMKGPGVRLAGGKDQGPRWNGVRVWAEAGPRSLPSWAGVLPDTPLVSSISRALTPR